MVDALVAAAGPPPRRAQLLQFYSSLHYEDRIKSKFDLEWARWKEAEAERRQNGESSKGKVEDHELAVRNAVRDRCWKEETEEFRQTVLDALEDNYLERKREYLARISTKTPGSAEELAL